MKQIKKTIYELMVYINLNLFEPLLLDNLSEKFNYSKYYLHREFKKETGMTVNNYVKQKRIENSIYYMFANINSSLTEIACCCGFTSGSFSREFKKVFGRTPKEWRNIYKKKSPDKSKICENYSRFLSYNDNGAPKEIIHISKVDMNEREISAVIFYGDYYSAGFQSFFNQIVSMNQSAASVFGIPLNSPSVTDKEHCLYLLGFECERDNPSLSRYTLNGGSFLKVMFQGERSRIGEIYTWLLKYYLPMNNLQYYYGTMIQEYKSAFTPEKADINLYIPVKFC